VCAGESRGVGNLELVAPLHKDPGHGVGQETSLASPRAGGRKRVEGVGRHRGHDLEMSWRRRIVGCGGGEGQIKFKVMVC
jgi:hypothetical protein